MIIDTTRTEVERKVTKKQNIKPPAKPDRRTEDEGGCSCHICPPCSYCVSRSECGICNEVVLNDDLVEFNNDWICEECALAAPTVSKDDR